MSRRPRRSAKQPGRQNGGLVATPVLDRGDQPLRHRVGQLVEPAPQHGRGGLGVAAGGGDVLVAEEALHVGDLHPQREQPGRHRVPQQVRVDALRDRGRPRHLAHDLPDPLPGQHVRRGPCALLPAGEERARAAGTDVQPQQLGELAADRHLPPLAALAAADDDHPLGQAHLLDPELDQLGDPGAGLEQGLQHEPGPPALGVGLVDNRSSSSSVSRSMAPRRSGGGASPALRRAALNTALLCG